MARPQNVGIKAMEIYFPDQCVEQVELEKFDGVSTGKYTIGLGQTKMSFSSDREDIYSICLTTVASLLRKYNIDPTSVGRLEVGTETMLDKSKSVKSVLMQLFEPSGNTNIEGVDTVNACYGGTNALFNSVSWIESSAWDGRNAIVVAGDVALYAKGAARPTGGVGCVAMLVGPDAPLVLEPHRGTYMRHTYDFYKADMLSEYPIVDGHYSLRCYSQALDACYKDYNARHAVAHAKLNGQANGDAAQLDTPLDRFDYMCFHSPTCKTVQKNYARLLFNDFLADPANPLFADVPAECKGVEYDASLTDKNIEKTFLALSKKRFEGRVKPATLVPTNCGNMYCASTYSSLASLLSNVASPTLQGKRIALFSYGSGLASSIFSIRVRGPTDAIAASMDVVARLAARTVVPPAAYDATCDLRERAHLKADYTPQGSIDALRPNTYYLTKVDDKFRREYAVKQ